MDTYLDSTEIIDWKHSAVLAMAQTLAGKHETSAAIAEACYTWVRDEVRHSADYQLNPVTCRASEVLEHRTGYCYAKSHLLAALLRANGILSGFCYQRLSINDNGAPYCLHGLNAVYLPDIGWYRLDARGNRADVNAQFTPPTEQLAYTPKLAEEADFPAVLSAPLRVVVEALQRHETWDQMQCHLPDISLDQAESWGLASL